MAGRRDEAAFVEFAAATQPRLRRTAYLLCGDWDRASDFVQEGLIRVYVAWPRLARNGGEHAYARKAVVSAFLDHARRRSSREFVTVVNDAAPSTVDLAQSVTDRTALMAALVALPARQRACVVLRYFEDLSVADTAVELGCTQGTVKSQTSKAQSGIAGRLADGDHLVHLTQGGYLNAGTYVYDLSTDSLRRLSDDVAGFEAPTLEGSAGMMSWTTPVNDHHGMKTWLARFPD